VRLNLLDAGQIKCGIRTVNSRSPTTLDSPQIGHPPDPDNTLALRTCSVSGKEFGRITARPSPQQPPALRTCPILGCPI
jgi:hypothetical protein